jgi:hypothetical protein
MSEEQPFDDPRWQPCLTTVTWREEEPEQFDFEVALDNWIKMKAPPEKPTPQRIRQGCLPNGQKCVELTSC